MSSDAARPILLIGAGGQIGRRLAARLPRIAPVVVVGRDELDLENEGALRDRVRRHEPWLVVNAAAYTGVDAAESDAQRCERVNADAPAILAAESARLGASYVDFSTNYVFDGALARPYVETDAVAPLNVYGRTKALGEARIAAANPDHLIFRTNGVYEWKGRNFLRRILDLAHERDELRVVDDQIMAPTPAAAIAEAVAHVVARLREPGWDREAFGIYHLTAAGEASWFDFARLLLELDPDRPRQRCRSLTGIAARDYPVPAARPRNGVLDNGRFARTFGFALPDWRAELERTIASREQP